MRMCMICRKNCSLVYHITQSYCISSGKEGFASRQHRCTSLLHLLYLIERNEWALFYPVEIVCDWTWWSTQAHWKITGFSKKKFRKLWQYIPGWRGDTLLSAQDQQDLAGQASPECPQEFASLLWLVSTPTYTTRFSMLSQGFTVMAGLQPNV